MKVIAEPPIPTGDEEAAYQRGDWKVEDTPFGPAVCCYCKVVYWDGAWERWEYAAQYVLATSEQLAAHGYELPESALPSTVAPQSWVLIDGDRAVLVDGIELDELSAHAPNFIRAAIKQLRARWLLGLKPRRL